MSSTSERPTVQKLRERALADLAALVPAGSTVALINFPNHGNPGDPAIWLGTKSLLRELRVTVAYQSAWWNLDLAQLRAALPPGGRVLLNGGGNFGDLYLGQQQQRERVLRELQDIPLVQMPQSIYFTERENLERVRDLIHAHGNFQLLVRETRSFGIATDDLGLSPVLSPDHALALGSHKHAAAPVSDILWVSWMPGAKEYRADAAPPEGATEITHLDWLDGAENAGEGARWLTRRAFAFNSQSFTQHNQGVALAPDQRKLARTYDPMARRWVSRGFDILGSARVVVTNKLHAHVFCALAGQPHVVLDNSYGKVLGVVDAWTRDLPGVHIARDAQHARELAHELLKDTQ
jgi:exopolysaccharide biosynthesis predicted pyruvyltransferase EpsI